MDRKSKIVYQAAGLFILFVFLLVWPRAVLSQWGYWEWEVHDVEAPRLFEEMSNRNIQVDEQQNVHVAYGRDHLYYARFDGSRWTIEVADASPNVGTGASLDLDSLGLPHISYLDGENSCLKYARKSGDLWITESVTTLDREGIPPTTLALDQLGSPHVVYADGGWVKYAYLEDETWSVEEVSYVSLSYLPYPSLSLDRAGSPHVLLSGPSLQYAQRTDSSWTFEIVDDRRCEMSSIVLDVNDRPHISYHDRHSSDLRYGVFDGSSWHTEKVGHHIEYNSLVLDSSGRPHIAYSYKLVYYPYWNLQYASWNDEEWQLTAIGTGGEFVSLSLDDTDTPHIVHVNRRHSQLRYDLSYTYQTDTEWQTQTIDEHRDVGAYTSMKLASNLGPNIAYVDRTKQHLKLARWENEQWNLETVDTDVDEYVALALDSSDLPHLAYAENKYAYYDGSEWHRETFDDGANGYTSLAVDSADRTHIFYDSSSNFRYALRDAEGWHVEELAGSGTVASSSSLALDQDDNPHVVFWRGGDHYGLYYAKKDAAGWQIEPTGYLHSRNNSSLTLDAAEYPHICYYRSRPQYGARHLYKDEAGWHTEIVDGWGGAGYHTSIVMDEYDRPYISYFHSVNHDLQFAARDGVEWRVRIIKQNIGEDGGYTSLMIDRYGGAHISFYNNALGDLQYAYCPGIANAEPPLEWSPASVSLVIEGPMPCRGSANLGIDADETTRVRIYIHDLSGRKVRDLFDNVVHNGHHRIPWDMHTNEGIVVSNGAYVATAEAGEQAVSKRIVVIR